MGFFDKTLIRDEASLFKNEVALSYDFLPKQVPFREAQQQFIADAIKPLFVERNGRNLIITGKPGVGKTVATKHILREIDDNYPDDVTTVFINCWQLNSSYKIAEGICHQLGFKLTQNKKTNELFSIAEKILNKTTVVFVFDEIDKAEDYDFLYELLENVYTKAIFLITNYPTWIDDLDERIRSRLMPETINFKQYSEDEVFGILKERTNYAFIDNIFEDDAIRMIAKKAHGVGDIRVGIYMLRESGLIAQGKHSKVVDVSITEDVVKKVSVQKSNSKFDGLSDEERLVFEVVSENPEKNMTELFKIYQKKGGKGVYKTFTRKIKVLEVAKLLVTKNTGGGASGNMTTVDVVKFDSTLDKFA